MPGRVGGLHAPLVVVLPAEADPHGRLRADAALGVRVQAEEVHAELGQLGQHGLVAVGVPPVGPLGKVVERLDPATVEKRTPRLVQLGQRQRRLAVGQYVAMQVEADAEVLCQPVGGIERADRVAADHEHQRPLAVANGLQAILLGEQPFDRGSQRLVGQQALDQRLLLAADHDARAVGRQHAGGGGSGAAATAHPPINPRATVATASPPVDMGISWNKPGMALPTIVDGRPDAGKRSGNPRVRSTR